VTIKNLLDLTSIGTNDRVLLLEKPDVLREMQNDGCGINISPILQKKSPWK
jgi:hypothetical protein